MKMKKTNKHFDEVTDAKGAYRTALLIATSLVNNELSVPRAKTASNLLTASNRTFALQIKYSNMTKDPEATMKKFMDNE